MMAAIHTSDDMSGGFRKQKACCFLTFLFPQSPNWFFYFKPNRYTLPIKGGRGKGGCALRGGPCFRQERREDSRSSRGDKTWSRARQPQNPLQEVLLLFFCIHPLVLVLWWSHFWKRRAFSCHRPVWGAGEMCSVARGVCSQVYIVIKINLFREERKTIR